jgi:hypothetical protein
MKNKSLRLALVSAVAVLSVLGLSSAPADAGTHVQSARNVWCC